MKQLWDKIQSVREDKEFQSTQIKLTYNSVKEECIRKYYDILLNYIVA
jgi:hypothetical protein